MADDQEKLLIDEEETVQIKDLNKVTTVNNTDLLLLDDGAASSNAITFKNFLDASKDKIFKGEGLDYFKQIIKSTIAEELAADKDFIKSIYDLIVDKLIENESSKLSNLFSKIKSRLTDNISSATLSKNDDLLIMSSSSIQKTPIPEQLLGVPSDFQSSYDFTRNTIIYPRDYKNHRVIIDLEDYNDVDLIFYKSDDDPIYLDFQVDVESFGEGKTLSLRYSDEREKNTIYSRNSSSTKRITFSIPLYKGWYVQKRAYSSGNPIPVLLKL